MLVLCILWRWILRRKRIFSHFRSTAGKPCLNLRRFHLQLLIRLQCLRFDLFSDSCSSIYDSFSELFLELVKIFEVPAQGRFSRWISWIFFAFLRIFLLLPF